MLARLFAVAVMIGPGVARAKGGHGGGHIHSGGFGGGFGSRSRPLEPPERWDTPVDQLADWDRREARVIEPLRRPVEYVDTGRSHVGARQIIFDVQP
jgi:hypothetical protein